MSFFKLIVKNPFRKKSKAILTIFGIVIAIVLIICSGGFIEFFNNSVEESITSSGGDFLVVEQSSEANLAITEYGITETGNVTSDTSNVINESIINEYINKLKNVDGVRNAIVTLDETIAETIDYDSPMYQVKYINIEDYDFFNFKIINGSKFLNSSQVMLGYKEAEKLNKTVGDNITLSNYFTLSNKTYEVAGIFKNDYYRYYIFASLDNVNLNNAEGNPYSVVIIGTLEEGADKNKVNASINAISPNFGAAFSKEDILNENPFKKLLDEITFTIKMITIFIGSILVGHAILSSVNDRKREIGVLKAVGWNNKRITMMIISESLVLCIIGWIIALIISLLIGFVLYSTMELQLIFTVYNIFESLLIVLAMGLIGSIFPVWKIVKLPPTEAISYE